MKKIIIFLTIILFTTFQNAMAKNIIYGVDIEKSANGELVLQLKSDYKGHARVVHEKNGAVYFDIKNAALADNYKTEYSNDISLVSQQIGSKVRIYLNGENIQNASVEFGAKNSNNPFDFGLLAIFCCISAILYLAYKFYSVTINLAHSKTAIKSPIQTAKDLNRQLYGFEKRHPEIVLSKANPIKENVLVDFQYAKDRKNTKIAI